MVIREDCGAVLDEDELVTTRSYVSDYMGGCYENITGCSCGGSVTDAERCDICGEYYREDELHDGICKDCLKEEMTVDNAIECGKDGSARVEVSINGFLASCFSQEQIDELLIKALEEKINASDADANKVIDMAEIWCGDDEGYFADWLKRRNKKQ